MAGPLPKPPPPSSRPLPSKPAGAGPARATAPKAAAAKTAGASAATTLAKPLGKTGARPLAKPAAKKATTTRASTLPRERKTLDGPWEWAFDRMLERKRAADAALKQQARGAAKRANAAQRPPAPPPV